MKKVLVVLSLLPLFLFVSSVVVSGDSLVGQDNFENIVIFIRFSDEEDYQAPFTLQEYEDMFNGVDMMSLRDYYLEASYDQLTIDSYLVSDETNVIYYTDIYPRSYYEPYDADTNTNGATDGNSTEREHNLLKRAVDYIDENNLVPDTLNLDVNNDSEIDSITFMISGEDTGWNSVLWPHKWELYTYATDTGFADDAPMINGVYAYTYTFELLGNNRGYEERVDVGVLAHETFHLIGAPDLYHYELFQNINPVGNWGLMDNSSHYPSHMLGYMKYKYGGWIDTVDEITETGSYTLYPLQDSPDNLYKIFTGIENEWVYIEYRDNDGLYENQLTDSGLIVYRVNTSIEGNESGSFNDAGHAADEVFVFRPFMDDTEEPIVVIDVSEDSNGSPEFAAITQDNAISEMGIGTSTAMFSSYGKIIDLKIDNVVEHDGYITFDVEFTPSINVNTNDHNYQYRDIVLFDSDLMNYTVNIDNLPENYDAYYTLNGESPTTTSTLYNGEDIQITADSNVVIAAIYEDGEFLYEIKDTFTFTEVIESNHEPYGNLKDITWYLEFNNSMIYDVIFDELSELEDDYDYVHVFDGTNTTTYTGTELQNLLLEFNNEYLFITLDSDPYVDDMFGFAVEIEAEGFVGIDVQGEMLINHEVGSDYIDEGATVKGEDITGYSIETISTVNDELLGQYEVTYNLLDSTNTVILTKTRLVYVVDTEAPTVSLIGDNLMVLEVGTEFLDPYIEFSDNYDIEEDITVEIRGSVVTDTINTSFITYVVTDSSGNQKLIFRTIKVVDTQAPTVSFEPNMDTIYVGETWIDNGVNYTDNFSETMDLVVTGEVDTTTPGNYTITYEVTDESGNTTTFVRIVTVHPVNESYEITCDPFNSSQTIDGPISIGDCYVNGQMMDFDASDIDSTEARILEVVYSYTLGEQQITYSQYIYVYDPKAPADLYAIVEKRRDYV
jgi:M6 family metalloprotease-like protein